MATATFDARAFDAVTRLARLRRLAWLLDAQFRLPGTKFRFGVNSLFGLSPVAGDVALGLISLYLIWEAKRLGAPKQLLGQMVANVVIEVAGGSVPILGDVFDMTFKANLRNLNLLERWLRTRP
ncbi:MAG: DUF4112 domain-containing protein [Acetobacteraceae bacterium]|nr:DUF4112 domain-containing protein [Acetobacteraceae bacterium]